MKGIDGKTTGETSAAGGKTNSDRREARSLAWSAGASRNVRDSAEVGVWVGDKACLHNLAKPVTQILSHTELLTGGVAPARDVEVIG